MRSRTLNDERDIERNCPSPEEAEAGGVLRSRAAVFTILGAPCEAIAAHFSGAPFARHFHDCHTFGLVMRGMNRFSYRNRSFEAGEGSIGTCDPGEVHDGGLCGAPWSYMSLFPSPDAMARLSEEMGLEGVPEFGTGHIADRASTLSLHALLETIFDEAMEQEAIEQLAREALGAIIAGNALGAGRRERAERSGRIARVAIEAIHDRWDEAVRIDELAAVAGASPFTTIRAVARATGLTPHAYLSQLKVDKAKAMVSDGLPIAEAAVASGFADQAHLTRAMKRRWGVTPGVFARAHDRYRANENKRSGAPDV